MIGYQRLVDRSRARSAPDGGFTLTELLVSMILFAIVGGAITVAATSGLRHQRQIQDRGDALATARTALQRVDRDIRSAAPLAGASGTALAMVETGSSNQLVCYLIQSTSGTTAELVQTTVTYPGSCPAAATTGSKILLADLVNTASTPVFSFTPVGGYVAPASGSVNAGTCVLTASPSSYDPSCIGIVTVQISVLPSDITSAVTVSDKGTEVRNSS
jgi:prepilin-type N-terminal cleavage/methylation domain-containing protein